MMNERGMLLRLKIKKLIPEKTFWFISRGIITGLLAGLIVSLFRLFIQYVFHFFQFLYVHAREERWLIAILILLNCLIAVIVGRLVKKDRNIKGSGIPQVKGHLHGEIVMNWFSVLWRKFLGGGLTIGSGLFLGREGPSIQLGAAIGQGVSEKTGGHDLDEKILISAGASAGLSAAFNAPVAGLVFSLEEVHHHFSPLLAVTCFTASITANFVSLYIFGMSPALNLGEIPIFPLAKYGWLILLGFILAIFGIIYQKLLFQANHWYRCFSFLPGYARGIIPLLLIIPIGTTAPFILGGGTDLILSLETITFPLATLLVIFAIRFFCHLYFYGSGLPGGIFLPVLTIGALIGAIFGQVLTTFGYIDDSLLRCFIVYAMAGYFTAICKAPLTGLLLISEMVGSVTGFMPMAIVVLSAYVFADILGSVPVYEGLLNIQLGKNARKSRGYYATFVLPVEIHNDTLVNKRVRDIDFPDESLLVRIRRGEKEIMPHGDTVVEAGDLLYISADAGKEREIRSRLNGQI